MNQALRQSKDNPSIYRAMLTVGLPVVIQHLISLGLNLVDVLMVGRLGVEALAAVGAANRIYSVFGMLCFGIYSGAAVFTSQYWGIKDVANIRRILGLDLITGLFIAFTFMAAALFAGGPLIYLFVKEAPVVSLGVDYLHIVLYSYPITAVSFAISYNCRAIHRLKVNTMISAFALSLNTALNYCLIYGKGGFPALGVEGAAIATLVARSLEMVLLIAAVYLTKDHPLAGRFSEFFSLHRRQAKQVFLTAMPVMIAEGSFTLGTTCYYIALGFLGTAAVGVMQVTGTLNEFFQSLFYGVGNAAAVLTGNVLGRNDKRQAYQNAKLFIRINILSSLLMTVLLLLLRGPIVRLYDLGEPAGSLFFSALTIYALYNLPRMLSYTLTCGILRAGGDTRFCMYVDIASVWLISVPLAFLGTLVFHLPLAGVLSLIFVGSVISALLNLKRFLSKKWLNILV